MENTSATSELKIDNEWHYTEVIVSRESTLTTATQYINWEKLYA